MSLLDCLCKTPEVQAGTAEPTVRGWRNKVEKEAGSFRNRSRSPHRRSAGMKSVLEGWAKGDCSAVAMWRVVHAISKRDGTNCGIGVNRLADLACGSSGSVRNCQRKLIEMLAETVLPKMIQEVPHEDGEHSMTHHLPPTEVIRMIHRNNRDKFAAIFTANKDTLELFWSELFKSDDGKEFQRLHPALKDKTAEQLKTTIPFHRS